MRESIYAPGAGHFPPELAGRDEIVLQWERMLSGVSAVGRRRAIDQVVTGLRGVGKSVLLTKLAEVAEERGYDVLRMQGNPETNLVHAIMAEAGSRSSDRWGRARAMLAEITTLSVSAAGFGAEVGREPKDTASGQVSSEGLARTLAELTSAGRKDQAAGLVISIDEFQMARPTDIRLIGAVLNQINTVHAETPIAFVAAGLPNTRARMIGPDPEHPYISNPERLFQFGQLGNSLSEDEAAAALLRPALAAGADWHPRALEAVIEASHRYPAHLQVYASTAWTHGSGAEPVTIDDVQAGMTDAARYIDQQYLQPRWDRLTELQRAYITALGVCGGRAAAGEVAAVLGTSVKAISERREALIRRGEIYDPEYGKVQLAMPAMRQFALINYPATVDQARGELITPAEMLAHHREWNTQHAKREPTPAFPPEVLDRMANPRGDIGPPKDPSLERPREDRSD